MSCLLWKDGQTDMANLRVAFLNFEKEPKIKKKSYEGVIFASRFIHSCRH